MKILTKDEGFKVLSMTANFLRDDCNVSPIEALFKASELISILSIPLEIGLEK